MITKILDLLDKGDHDITDLTLMHLLTDELDKELNRDVYSAYDENLTLKELIRKYSSIISETRGMWVTERTLIQDYYDLTYQLTQVRKTLQAGNILSRLEYPGKVSLFDILPHQGVFNPMEHPFRLALIEFQKNYEKMLYVTHEEKINIIKNAVKLPKAVDCFIQDEENGRETKVSISTRTNDTITKRSFYLDNWEIVSSKGTYDKDKMINSSFTEDKEIANYFWPENFL